VEGRLRNEALSVDVSTECAHCKQPMHLTIDHELSCTVRDKGCKPVVFIPDVDLLRLEEESIINAF
jgi:hypothetical protein